MLYQDGWGTTANGPWPATGQSPSWNYPTSWTVTTYSVGSIGYPAAPRSWKLAESCSPPPVPVELASRPPVVLPPPQALRRPTHLARLQGGTRERRALRRSIERKEAMMA
jgi:hypothetical protein